MPHGGRSASCGPACGRPWGGKGTGAAGGPCAVSRVRRDLIMLAVSLAVFTACAVIVANGRVGSAERAGFHAGNGLPGWLYQPMLYAQYLGRSEERRVGK